jgi:hypothetical protein
MKALFRVTHEPNLPDPEGWVVADTRAALEEIERIIPGSTADLPIDRDAVIISANEAPHRVVIHWHPFTADELRADDALTKTEAALDQRDEWLDFVRQVASN